MMTAKESHIILDYLYTHIEWSSLWDEVSFVDPELRRLYDGFRATSTCPYCRHRMKRVLQIGKMLDEDYGEGLSINIWGCPNCGWWCQVRDDVAPFGECRQTRQMGILKEFNSSDSQLPLITLKTELAKHPDVLYDIHSRKFEELVADIIGDVYETEVTIIGRTNDGGIDLVYLDSDIPTAIQVKRRQQPEKIETVSLVREFLGAMMLRKFTRGKIVTTADRFSKGSYGTSEEAVSQGLVEQFELIDIKRFLDLFRFHSEGDIRVPWQFIIRKRIKAWKGDPRAEITVF